MAMIKGIFLIAEDEKICCNCKHFWQHYIYNKIDKRFEACNAGHCGEPRLKKRKPDCKACEHFERRITNE